MVSDSVIYYRFESIFTSNPITNIGLEFLVSTSSFLEDPGSVVITRESELVISDLAPRGLWCPPGISRL